MTIYYYYFISIHIQIIWKLYSHAHYCSSTCSNVYIAIASNNDVSDIYHFFCIFLPFVKNGSAFYFENLKKKCNLLK